MNAIANTRMTVEQYLDFDRKTEERHEYCDGLVLPKLPVPLRHAAISTNLVLSLNPAEDSRAHVLCGVRVEANSRHLFYPDLFAYSNPPAIFDEHEDMISNPIFTAEIVAPNKIDYCLGRKFTLYRQMPTMKECLLVWLDEPHVALGRRISVDTWSLTTYKGLDACFFLESLGITIRLSDIYSDLPAYHAYPLN